MTILRFDKRFDFANRFVVHPSQSFSSSSLGVTGSIKLTNVFSGIRKSLVDKTPGIYDESSSRDAYIETLEKTTGSMLPDISAAMQTVFEKAHAAEEYTYDKKVFEIKRVTPALETVFLPDIRGNLNIVSVVSTGSHKKNTIRKLLYFSNNGIYRKCDWAYSNTNVLNFFTASSVEQNSAVIYSDPTGTNSAALYRPDDAFTFEFFINPRYTTDAPGTEFTAGTIFHYSSAYALSVMTGSSVSIDGRPNGFRLLLQLSSSADISPSNVSTGSGAPGYPLIFSSSDNSLMLNKWHHVAVRWGGNHRQRHTGSFVINEVVDTEFVIPSASITAPPGSESYAQFDGGRDDANALFVGAYFNAPNISGSPTQIKRFFNTSVETREGIPATDIGAEDPLGNLFTNKLNAELHELRIYKEFKDIEALREFGYTSISAGAIAKQKLENRLAFYVPVLFTPEAPTARVFERPFTLSTSAVKSTTPFNVTSSFNSETTIINPTNYLRDFANSKYPRLFNMTGSTSLATEAGIRGNTQLLKDPQMNARNLLILPNDNGLFSYDFSILLSGSYTQTPATASMLRRYVNDNGLLDLSIVSLNRMLDGRAPKKYNKSPGSELFEPYYSGSLSEGFAFYSDILSRNNGAQINDFDDEVDDALDIIGGMFYMQILSDGEGTRANSPSTPNQKILNFYVFEATGDESSNEVVIFDIPKPFYGTSIRPGSLTLADAAITGSSGKVSITLKDDGFGSLYRADSPMPSKLNSVGNVFYNEGIVVIKSPHLFSFGASNFLTSFEGTHEIINREIYAVAPKSAFNFSTNEGYQALAPTADQNETANNFVYISEVLLHDKNLNVVGRARIAQPIKKRIFEQLTFKLKQDF